MKCVFGKILVNIVNSVIEKEIPISTIFEIAAKF